MVPINLEDGSGSPLTLDASDGTVCINPETDEFTICIGDDTVEPGENFCVPVSVLNYENILGINFTVNYDPDQLQFQQVTNLNTTLEGYAVASNFGLPTDQNIGPGFVTTFYTSSDLTCYDLPNGAVLFELCFTAIGDDGDESDIFISGDITSIEVSDCDQQVINVEDKEGTINISEIQPPQIIDFDVTNVLCAGESTGSIAVQVSGGTGQYSYTWSPDEGNTATIDNLSQGTYNLTITDLNSGLTTMASYTVFAPSSSINIAGGITSPTCQGGCNGTVFTNVSGGTPGYTYQWATLPNTTSSLKQPMCR